MFSFFTTTFKKVFNRLHGALGALFSRSTIDAQSLKELESLLIQADVGSATTQMIIERIKKACAGKEITGAMLKEVLEQELLQMLKQYQFKSDARIFLLVGVNGSGKTTSAAKLAYEQAQAGKKVLLVAADTFRAGAVQQLMQWGERLKIPVVVGKEGQDPASVVYVGCQQYIKEHYDVLIVDTAGRLQTKSNLMKELEKIRNVIGKACPGQSITTLLTVDSMLGQNVMEQARLFHESTPLQGIILTKFDGTGKGGIIFAIANELQVPIAYIAYGEQLDAWMPFNAQEFVARLLE